MHVIVILTENGNHVICVIEAAGHNEAQAYEVVNAIASFAFDRLIFRTVSLVCVCGSSGASTQI